MTRLGTSRCIVLIVALTCRAAGVGAEQVERKTSPATAATTGTAAGAVPPPGYVIGPADVLSIVFWRDKEMSADVTVRPDGKISLPLLNEIYAAGFTPEQLRDTVTKAAERFIDEPNATVVVREINSRKVFITGSIEKPGTFTLAGPMTVLQLIATAGGLKEYADKSKIVILRSENGKSTGFQFNYKQVVEQKKMSQNIELKPGDTVIVP